jgi:hypothetical protein
MTEAASKVADENEGMITVEDVLYVLQQTEKSYDLPFEGSDPKVLEFLQILEEYRVKCEEEGNYLEAARAYRQLGVLRKQEEKRQQKAIQARQISEKQDVQLAHNMQFSEFNKSWDKYLEDYDNMAQTYIQQMTERHAVVLLDFQKQLRQDLASKPPKWSRELLDQRRKQHINARNKNYTQAQKLKKQSDRTEEKERRDMEQAQAVIFARREAKFRMQQQTELQALLKRIEGRRKEHIKQRSLDTKRLLQRNRNVQAVLDSKQATECQKLFAEIKKTLYSSAALHGGAATSVHTNTIKRGGGSSTAGSYNGSASGGNSFTGKYQQQQQQQQQQYQQQQYDQQQQQFQQNVPKNSNGNNNNGNDSSPQTHQPQYSSEAKSNGGGAGSGSGSGGQYKQGGYTPGGEDSRYDQNDDNYEEENDEAYNRHVAPKSPAADPVFMQQPGPNFNNLVYAPGESYEDESLDDGLEY